MTFILLFQGCHPKFSLHNSPKSTTIITTTLVAEKSTTQFALWKSSELLDDAKLIIEITAKISLTPSVVHKQPNKPNSSNTEVGMYIRKKNKILKLVFFLGFQLFFLGRFFLFSWILLFFLVESVLFLFSVVITTLLYSIFFLVLW